MYTKLKKLLPTLMLAWAMAAVMLLAGTGAPDSALALTTTDCRGCHTPAPPATITTMHHTLATTMGYSCSKCHKTISDGTGGFTIEISRDCGTCHSMVDHAEAHDKAFTAPDCAQCHTLAMVSEHTSRGSTCATCHSSTKPEVQNTISIGMGPNGVPVNCNNCHISVNHIQDHDKAVPSAECVTCHAQGVVFEHLNRTSTCGTCHQSTNPAVVKAIADGRAGTTVNCVSCHGSVNHIQQHNMVSTPVDCSSCHNQGPVYEHTNRTSTCATCHNSTNAAVQKTITDGRNNIPVSCANCHGQVNHVLDHDKALANADCAQCHNLGVVNEHTSRGSSCATCHNNTNQTVRQTIAAGKAGTTVYCSNCHVSVNHIQQHDMVATPADCKTCHAKQVVYEHTDRGSTCGTCHQSTNAAVLKTITDGRAGITVSCANCHGAVNHIQQHEMAFASPACAQCHTKSVLDEHLTRTSTCATCHSSSSSMVQDAITKGRSGQAVYCVDCHGQVTHQNAHDGKVVVPYSDCNSCHMPNLVDLHAQGGFQCAACHASSNTAVNAAVQKGLGGQIVKCSDCHNAIGGFGNHAGQHDKITLSDATGFIAAHEEVSVHCFACHTNTSAGYQKAINDGMAGIPQNCGSCHAATGNQPPAANAGADVTTGINQAVTLSGAGSSDADGTIASYVWTFGDGTSGSGASVTKTYTTAGTYTATLTVTDNAGASASDTTIVTVQAAPTSSAVFADQVQHMQRLKSITSSDSNSTDVTAKFRDSNLTDRYLLQYKSGENYVVAMRLNRDALTTTKVVLRVYVSSISSSRTLRIYPYQSGGTSVNTSYYVNYSVNSTGWKDIDVTSIAQRMNGYGWMKFRVTPTSSSLSVAEGAFLVQ